MKEDNGVGMKRRRYVCRRRKRKKIGKKGEHSQDKGWDVEGVGVWGGGAPLSGPAFSSKVFTSI